jgi:pyrophosphate--fructose-6-phosphate 1-phosphotransferase
MRPKKVALLTAGGLAPCLNAAIAGLIERYTSVAGDIQIICYRGGYKGLLLGDSIAVGPEERAAAHVLRGHGGSAIGNSRVKLTNVKDCVKRGLVKEGQNPLQVAAEQLVCDGVDVLHTIGGDDTNTTAADLAAYLAKNNYELTVIGLPKTIDNDVIPIRQSLGAWTAAEQGALFFERVVAEWGAYGGDGARLPTASRPDAGGRRARAFPRPAGGSRSLCARARARHRGGSPAAQGGDGTRGQRERVHQ